MNYTDEELSGIADVVIAGIGPALTALAEHLGEQFGVTVITHVAAAVCQPVSEEDRLLRGQGEPHASRSALSSASNDNGPGLAAFLKVLAQRAEDKIPEGDRAEVLSVRDLIVDKTH